MPPQTLEQEKKEKMLRILSELKEKIGEIDELKRQLRGIGEGRFSAEKSRALLEEIKVPSLELIKETERKHKAAEK